MGFEVFNFSWTAAWKGRGGGNGISFQCLRRGLPIDTDSSDIVEDFRGSRSRPVHDRPNDGPTYGMSSTKISEVGFVPENPWKGITEICHLSSGYVDSDRLGLHH